MPSTKFRTNKLIAEISIAEEGEIIVVSIGGVERRRILLSVYEDPYRFHITNLSLGKCKGQGIGSECLRFHKESFDSPITAALPFDPSEQEDGSHLTGDGIRFVQKMRAEGIVRRPPDEYVDDTI